MAVLVRNHYTHYFSFLCFFGRLSSAVGNDDVHRSASWRPVRNKLIVWKRPWFTAHPGINALTNLSKHKILLWNYHPYVYPRFFFFFFFHNLPKSFNCTLNVLFMFTKWGELSSESGASCLRASFSWGELSWGELIWGELSCFACLVLVINSSSSSNNASGSSGTFSRMIMWYLHVWRKAHVRVKTCRSVLRNCGAYPCFEDI